MNTFQSMNIDTGENEPVSVDKRYYFDNDGYSLKEEFKVFKMNTENPSNASFYDRDVEIIKKLEDVEYYKILNE